MVESNAEAELRRNLGELHRYLSDEIAPLMAAEAIQNLIQHPPKMTAVTIRNWIEAQYTTASNTVPVANYVYHSMKKLHLLTEFELIDSGRLMTFMQKVAGLLVSICPEESRAGLKVKLSQLGEARDTLSAPVKLLHRQMGDEEEERQIEEMEKQAAEEEKKQEEEKPRDAKSERFDLLINRLEEALERQDGQAGGEESPAAEGSSDVLTQLMTTAALEAEDGVQFDGFMARLQEEGIDGRYHNVFRSLGKSLPGWALPEATTDGETVQIPMKAIEAMYRIVTMAADPTSGAKRLGEMIYAAIEQFNEGHLAQAVAMIDLAERLISEKKVDPEVVKQIRRQAQDSIAREGLRRFAHTSTKHGLLRRILQFFPALRPVGLLESIEGEANRSNRKLLLALLEVHGKETFLPVLQRLKLFVTGEQDDPQGYQRRNLIFLLRRIGRDDDDLVSEVELALLERSISPGTPPMVVKEAMGALGGFGNQEVEKMLIDCLTGLEEEVLGQQPQPYSIEESIDLMDRNCAALSRYGSRNAVRTVVRHAFSNQPALGDSISRLDHLSSVSMAGDPDQLDKLIESLRNLLPTKVLGMVVKKNNKEITHHIKALSGTPVDDVRELFREIVARYPGQEFAELAGNCLKKLETAPVTETAARDSLSGDLEMFALPELFQSLASNNATGKLVLSDRHGRARSTITLSGGLMLTCNTGKLEGLEAFYQLFERPLAGTFSFNNLQVSELPASGTEVELLPEVLEGLRRHDEFQMCRALVPDGAILAPTGKKPTPPPDEADSVLLKKTWVQAVRGMAPETCEALSNTDSFRIRRMYAHWTEEGALKPKAAGNDNGES